MSMLDDLFSLHGKTALVTGASGGIGRELAIGLSGAGAAVAIHGRDLKELETTLRQIESAGGRGITLPADLRELPACRKLIEDTVSCLGGLDILVNCAGMNRRKPIVDVTEDDFDAINDVNLKSLFFLSQSAHGPMRRAGGGKIVQIASLTTYIGLSTTSVYGATKAAVAQLAKTQAVEWAKDNIQVNCLAPGFIRTPLTAKSLWSDADKRQWLLDRIPARRAGEPRDMLTTLLLLVAPGSGYLTGQCIAVDGGVLAGGSWED